MHVVDLHRQTYVQEGLLKGKENSTRNMKCGARCNAVFRKKYEAIHSRS